MRELAWQAGHKLCGSPLFISSSTTATLTQPVVTINLNFRWLVQAGTELMRPENRFTQIVTKTECLTKGVHHGPQET
jgi:hypothetical protein